MSPSQIYKIMKYSCRDVDLRGLAPCICPGHIIERAKYNVDLVREAGGHRLMEADRAILCEFVSNDGDNQLWAVL